MICKMCGKEFNVEKIRGGCNRIFCYNCLPKTSDRNLRNRNRKKLLLEYSNKIKLEKGCARCGYKKCAKALEWHHHDDDKLENPSVLLSFSIEKYLDEISKCELLCANCHREVHDKYRSVV